MNNYVYDIIFLDRDEYITNLICTGLQENGFRVGSFKDWNEAINILSINQTKILIFNEICYNIDIEEYIKRAKRVLKNTKIILTLEKEVDEFTRNKYFEKLKIDNLLIKPFSILNILEIIEQGGLIMSEFPQNGMGMPQGMNGMGPQGFGGPQGMNGMPPQNGFGGPQGMPPQQGFDPAMGGMPPQGFGGPQGMGGMPPQNGFGGPQGMNGMPPQQGFDPAMGGMPPQGFGGPQGMNGMPPQNGFGGPQGMPPQQGFDPMMGGMPPQNGMGMPPQGMGMPPQGMGMPLQQGFDPMMGGMPPQGFGGPQGMPNDGGMGMANGQQMYGMQMPTGTNAMKQIIIAINCPKGGVGKTTISKELAVAFATKRVNGNPLKVCLVDGNLGFGDVTTMLKVPSMPNIKTWTTDIQQRLRENPDVVPRYSQQTIEENYLIRHQSGLYILAAPSSHTDSLDIDAEQMGAVIDNLKECNFDVIIIDTANNTSDYTLIALEKAQTILMITTLEVTSINDTRCLIQTLREIQFPVEKIKLVVNKMPQKSDKDIDLNEISAILQIPILATVPDFPRVRLINNNGEPAMMGGKANELTLAISEVAAKVAPAFADDPNSKTKGKGGAGGEKKSLFGGLFGKK